MPDHDDAGPPAEGRRVSEAVDPQLRQQVARFDPSVAVERAWTPPSSWYTSPGLHQLERREIFGRRWQPVAQLAGLTDPGAYATGCIAGEPWLVVRGADDRLRAFSNTCRHKGREVMQGQGHAERLVCGYHAWAYDLTGRLRSAPRMGGVQGFDRETMSLPPLSVEAWGPWAWVEASGHAEPLRPRVSALDRMLERTEWDRLRFHSRASWTLACNWKVYVDNYLDGGYHIPHMHPSLDAQIDMASYRTDLFDEFSVQTAEPRVPAASSAAGSPPSAKAGAAPPSSGLVADPEQRIGSGAIYAWIYPNIMLNRYGPCLDTSVVIPLGPDRCRVDSEFYFVQEQGPSAQRFVEQSIEQAEITQHEDIAICESVQVGLQSRHYEVGRYAPQVEQGEHHFHRLLAADLRRAVRLPAV